jgi:hypothetical protein
VGIEEKLRRYSLVLEHKVGGPKAKGFLEMLGISLASIDYLAQEIRVGIAHTPISGVRLDGPEEASCLVQFLIAGPGRYSHRTASIRTAWKVEGPSARPRMVTAYPRDERGR